MSDRLQCISPIDGSVYVERNYANDTQITDALSRAKAAQAAWHQVPGG